MLQTTQQTAKKWKALRNVGGLTALAGAFLLLSLITMIEPAAKGLLLGETWAAITVVLGLAGYVAGLVGGWRFHD
jgi:hypothetical protein